MPNNTSTTSELADETSSALSVLDFLYHDSRRVASFLSQFEGDGHLQQFTRKKQGTKGKRDSSKHEGKANIGIVAGKLQGGTETSLDMQEGYDRVFDPYWANARAFLDYLSDRDLIQRDIESARIGQFALVTGSLIVADMNLLQSLWGLPAIKQTLINAAKEAQSEGGANEGDNRQQRRAGGKSKGPTSQAIPLEMQVTMEVLPHLPHSAHLHVVTDDYAVWAPAADNSLVTPASDLVLKHGAKVAGQWSMLGILDGLPFEASEMMTPLEMIRVGMTSESIAKAALNLAPTIREAIGRPLMSYGMTPLLVFREVI